MRSPRPGDGLAKALFGRDPQECYPKRQCVVCGGPAKEFNDELSEREYHISVTCQVCQNEVF